MDEQFIRIKCPFCSSVLATKKMPGLEKKSITCPVCKKKSPFTNYKKIANSSRQPSGDPTLVRGLNINTVIGKLTVLQNGQSYQLKEGINVIGRNAVSSTADFKIPGNMRMSRQHLIIEVKEVPGKGLVHYASLYKNETNETYIGSEKLEYGDRIVLKDGVIIKLPGMDLKFEMVDPEGTCPYDDGTFPYPDGNKYDPEATALRD
ncbi:MAG: FHA domain-containing protein [Prevotella sp.]|nr:FHA domain-containing protein [Prevotella sp.]